MQRFRFNKIDKQVGGSTATYVAKLRKLAELCEFGTSLENMLRDRLVCGVADRNIQHQLLAESSLTFQTALNKVLAGEAATARVTEHHATVAPSVPAIHAVTSRGHEEQKQTQNTSVSN